jgi:Mg-chelatase subunit ChlD
MPAVADSSHERKASLMPRHRRAPLLLAALALIAALACLPRTGAGAGAPRTPAGPDQAGLTQAYRLAGTWDGARGQSAPGAVLYPAGIDVTDQVVALVDRGNDRVQTFAPDGRFLAAWGQRGTAASDLSDPRDVSIDGSLYYVTDAGNHRIAVFASDGQALAPLAAPGLDAPWGIAARGGRVYVSQPVTGEVFVFDQGALAARWAIGGDPRGLALAADGRVYVADHAASAVRIYNREGQLVSTLATTLAPIDVAVDPAGDVYVQSEAAILWYAAGASTSRQALYFAGMQGIALSTRHGLYASVARMDSHRDPSFHGVVRYPWRPQDGLPSAPAGQQPQWALLGFPPGRLHTPHAVHIGPSGRIWVLDDWPRLQAFDAAGQPVRQVVPQTTPGIAPVDLAESPRGELLVGEARRLLRVAASGAVTQSVRLGDAGGDYWLTALAWQGDGLPRVTVLDSTWARARDYGVTRTLQPIASWPLEGAGAWSLHWDLGVPAPNPAARTYVVRRGARQVGIFEHGRLSGTWAIDGVPTRLAVGPGGDVFVLSVDGVVHKFDPTGTLLAQWDVAAFSAGASEVVDLAVDAAGRVYTVDRAANTVRVWERDPAATPEPPSSRGSTCRLRGDKRAEPEAVQIGQRVTVRLQVGGECPNAAPRADIVLALDRSGSMNASNKITATREAALVFLGAIDLGRDRVAVVSFNNGARLVQPLTGDRSAAETAVRAITAVGGTNIAEAFTVSTAELFGPNRRADAQPVIVLLTDGRDREPDDALAAAADARAGGARVFTIGFGDVDPMVMTLAATSPEYYYYAPDPTRLTDIYRLIAQRITADVLAVSMTVVDTLPPDMRYVVDSARPAATWDAAARTLTWQLTRVPFGGITLEFVVEPTQLGRRPTNVQASADYVDGLTSIGRLRFPVPEVSVLDRAPTPTPTYTPYPTATPRPTETPLPPEPLYLPALLHQQCRDKAVHADVAIVMDTSSSMSLPAAGDAATTKLAVAITAARTFVGLLTLPGDQATVITFDSSAALRQPLTGDLDALLRTLGELKAGQGTRIDLGIRAAAEELTGPRAVAANNHVVVLLTDGQNTGAPDSEVRDRATEAKAAHIVIYTVGLGADVDAALLEEVASYPEYAFLAPTTSELVSVYRDIAYTIACPNLAWP